MEKWSTRTTLVPPKLSTGVLDIFRVEKIYNREFTRRVSLVEFVTIGMIFMLRGLSLTQLSQGVEKIRVDVRSVEKIARSYEWVSKLVSRFILEFLPRLILRNESAQSTPSSTYQCARISPISRSRRCTYEPAPSFRSSHAPKPKKRRRKRR